MAAIGFALFAIGTLVTLCNFYLSWLRPLVHLLVGGTRETYKWVSGIPLFGSVLLWISVPLLPSDLLRWIAAILSLFDTGGIHWFIATMIWTGQLGSLMRGPK